MYKVFGLIVIVIAVCASAQTSSQGSNSMPGMDMSHPAAGNEGKGNAEAMQSMQDRHMGMGPHMKMTALRPLQPGDKAKAMEIEQAARQVAQKFLDYKVALADGYQIFLPNVRRSNTTSPTITTRTLRETTLIPRCRHPCSTRRVAMATNSSGSCTPPGKTLPRTNSMPAFR